MQLRYPPCKALSRLVETHPSRAVSKKLPVLLVRSALLGRPELMPGLKT